MAREAPEEPPEGTEGKIKTPGELVASGLLKSVGSCLPKWYQGKVKPCKSDLYCKLYALTLGYEALVENAYPLDTPEEPEMVLLTEYFRPEDDCCETKTCSRCKKPFEFTSKGVQIADKPCRFCPGQPSSSGSDGDQYQCSGSCSGWQGCQVRPYHINPAFVKRKVKFSKTGRVQSPARNIFAMDTEMCITEEGSVATKVTVVDTECRVVFHALMKPGKPIVDYVTQYSGVTEEDLDGVEKTLDDVKSVLLSMIDESTILVGHGLQNDLRALSIIHSTVVDTSVIFPDPKGHPYKKSLKALVSDFLKYEVQPEGKSHNSIEDAQACMRLVLYYMKYGCKLPDEKPPESPPYYPGPRVLLHTLPVIRPFNPVWCGGAPPGRGVGLPVKVGGGKPVAKNGPPRENHKHPSCPYCRTGGRAPKLFNVVFVPTCFPFTMRPVNYFCMQYPVHFYWS